MELAPSPSKLETIDICTELQERPKPNCSKVTQRTPTLRKRKTAKKTASEKALDNVSDFEILLMSLPASSCRVINCKLRQTAAWIKTRDKEDIACVTASDGFHVKTGNQDLYQGELNFRELSVQPSGMCPYPDVHTERLRLGKDLPLACPTCWSLQRN